MFWAQLISSLGDWVTLFASFTLAARIAGPSGAASIAILVPLTARILPGLLGGVIGGVIADRWDRKTTMVAADIGRAVLVAALVLVDNFRNLFLLTFAIEILSLIRQPAREAVTPHLIPERHLMTANGLNLIASYGTAPVGSALFAGLIEIGDRFVPGFTTHSGVAAAFGFDALTFLASGLLVLSTRLPVPEPSGVGAARGRFDLRAPFRDMVDGFRFVSTFPAARRTVLGVAFALFGAGAVFVLGQPFSREVLGGRDFGFGLLVTALGSGATLGMLVMTLNGKRIVRTEPVFGFALLVAGAAISLAALAPSVWVAAAWILLAGIGSGVAYVAGFTRLHSVITDDIRGRTFATLYAGARVALLLSFGLAGVGATGLDGLLWGRLGNGIRLVLWAGGMLIASTGTMVLWLVRRQLVGDPMDEESLRALQEAGDAITWMRGDRRSRPE